MDSIGLLGRLIADSNRIGYDAVAEHLGGALPLFPESVARPDVLNRLLREHGIDAAADAQVSSVELLDIKSISSNCNNSVVRVERNATPSNLPSTLFVKLPSTQLWTRLFCNLLGIWSNECHFYRHAASRVPIALWAATCMRTASSPPSCCTSLSSSLAATISVAICWRKASVSSRAWRSSLAACTLASAASTSSFSMLARSFFWISSELRLALFASSVSRWPSSGFVGVVR